MYAIRYIQEIYLQGIDMGISLKKAAFINAISRYTQILFNLLLTMVLARILTPEDYGIVAVTTVFTTFFLIFSDMGISNGIIQYKTLNEQDIADIFSFTILVGFFLGILFCISSFFIADFYDNAVYVPLGGLLAINLFASTCNIVPNALLLKDKQFLLLAKRNIIITIFISGITVMMAFLGMKYYALVMQSLFSSLVLFIYNYITAHNKYSLYVSKKIKFDGVRKIFSYSIYQFLFCIIGYFSRNLDNLLIGRVWGAAYLGFYDKAYRLMCYPIGSLTNVITPVLQPILSEYQDNKSYIYERYVRMVKFLSLIGVIVTAVFHFMADEVVYILFGAQWIETVIYLKWLSLSVWAQIVLGTTGSIFQSAGDTKHLFFTGCVTTIMTVSAIIVGILSGSLENVARNVMISYNVQFFFVMYMLIKVTLKHSYIEFIVKFLPEVVIGVVIFLGMMFSNMLEDNLTSVQYSLLKLAVIIIMFFIMAKSLGQFKYINIIRK